jgi:hypothetical protein
MLRIGVGIAGVSEFPAKSAVLEGGLKREAGVETRGTGIAHDVRLRFAGGFR